MLLRLLRAWNYVLINKVILQMYIFFQDVNFFPVEYPMSKSNLKK